MSVEASCPACGATISFKIGSSIVVVCDYCHSVIARGDRALEDLGKVADIVDTGSPLDIGLTGVYQGVRFELTGRAQLGHEAGGVWDEWYAAFQDGRWGWLAEAQGKFYMTFEQSLPEQSLIPPYAMLQLGEPVSALSIPLSVAEKGQAEALGAKGEIPYKLVPGSQYLYADLSGPHGVFATLDYGSQPPAIYIGREVPLAEFGFLSHAPEREARRVESLQLSCPNCGGPLELRAPDSTKRVTCPNCGSLLDVSQGKLEFLQALDPKIKPLIPIGTTGEFEQGQLMIIGFAVRSVEFEGVRYYWEEYLLYNPQIGFRWLVRSDDNWNFVEPVPPGDVQPTANARNVQYNGEVYRLYQDTIARVEHVAGEFYWEVTAGEQVRAADFIHPPFMLSKEVSLSDASSGGEAPQEPASQKGKRRRRKATVDTGEVNWSLGTFLRPAEVEKAFGTAGLPRTSKIAPNQPFLHKKVYKYWGLLLLASFVVGIVTIAMGAHRKVYEASFALEPLKNAEDSQVKFTDPFELKARQNIRVSAQAQVDNSWLEVQGDIIDANTNESVGFSLPVEYYHGVEDGEAWSEGDKTPSTYLSAPPTTGNYMLGLEVRWEKWQQPATVTVRVEQGYPHASYMFVTMVFLCVIPVGVAFYQLSFEKRRWADSDYSPYQSE